jgi:hypothetical protein
MRAALMILATALPLVACAAFRQDQSWSDELSKSDTVQIAGTIAAFLLERVPPGDSKPLAIAPASGATANEMEALLGEQLQQHGYILATTEAAPEAHRLRYLITKYDGGYALRFRLDTAEATTVLSRGKAGELVASTPLAVREAVR